MKRKGISLVVLIVTIVVLIILAGAVIVSVTDDEIIDDTQNVVDGYKKRATVNNMQLRVETEGMKKLREEGTRQLELEEIEGIMGEYGKYNSTTMYTTTEEGIKVSLFEASVETINDYVEVIRENGKLSVIETLPEVYEVEYTVDGGTTWHKYTGEVAMQAGKKSFVRVVDEDGGIISDPLSIIGNRHEYLSPMLTISPMSGEGKSVEVTITATEKGGSELAKNNEYKYYLSTSATEQTGGSWQTYELGKAFTVGTGLNGIYYMHLKSVKDNDNNESGIIVSDGYLFDNIGPTIVVGCEQEGPTNATTITYSILFSEPVYEFGIEDIVVTNGKNATLTKITETTYSLTVETSANQNNTQKVSVLANKCIDRFGNNNTVSNEVAVAIDRLGPKITITCDKTGPTNAETLTYTLTFSEIPNGFEASDITVSNGINPTLTKQSDTVYILKVNTSANQENTQSVSVAANKLTDALGNNNSASNVLAVAIDRLAPTIAITCDKASPTNAEAVTYTITTSEAVEGLEASDVTVTNGTNPTLTKQSDTKYTLTVNTSANQENTQSVSVAANKFTDKVGHSNSASNEVAIAVDRVAPTIKLSVNGNSTYAKSQSTTIQVTENTNVTYSYGWSQSNTVAPTSWTVGTSKSQVATQSTGDGNYYLWIKDVKDKAGNMPGISTVGGISTVNIVSNLFALDNTPPEIVSIEAVPAYSNELTKRVHFKDALSGFNDPLLVSYNSSCAGTAVSGVLSKNSGDVSWVEQDAFYFSVHVNSCGAFSSSTKYSFISDLSFSDKAGNVVTFRVFNESILCFVEGTKVYTENGLVDIETIKEGDKVYSYNDKTGVIELKEVEETSTSIWKTYKVETESGEIIEGTGSHKVYVKGFGYKKIQDLKVNDELVNKDGKLEKIKSVTMSEEEKMLYNINVADNNNYFVGEGMYLVEDLIQTEELKQRYNNVIYKITNAIDNMMKN